MKKIFLLIITFHIFVSAFAFRIEHGNNIIISQPVYENLYVAGGSVTINAPIHGDLIIAGGTIIINDSVTNDILLAAGRATFNGFVGGDIRCAGGNIRIIKSVTGDVVVTGGRVSIDKGVTIGSLLMSGGNITVDGDVKGAFGNLFLNGDITKDVDCRGRRITVNGKIGGKSVLAARYIYIGNDAVFNDNVRYWNKQDTLDFKQSLKNGNATYDPSIRVRLGEWYYLGASTIFGLLWYLGMALLMIMIVQYLFSTTMKEAADTVFNHTLKSLGFGLLFLIGVPVIVIISFITIIGVPVGLLLVFSYITLLLLSTIITSIITANWFNNRNSYEWNYRRIAFTSFGIFILLKLISLIPFAGWLILILMVCISFGSILINVNWRKNKY